MSDTTQSLIEGSKNVANKMADSASQAFDETTRMASNAAEYTVGSVTNSLNTVQETASEYLGNMTSVFYGIFGLLIVSFLVGYGVYVIISDNVTYQQKIVVEDTKTPLICNELKMCKIDKYLDNKNGKRRTYSFWIYIHDISKYSRNQYRHIAHIGESARSIIGSTPYIILDKISNKIHVRFAPEDDSALSTQLTSLKLNEITDIDMLTRYSVSNEGKYCGFTIEYVPIQRWVHIAFTINDSNKGLIYIYVDGELIDVKQSKFDFNLNISELKVENKGNLYVGGDANDASNGLTGFSGLLSKFSIYNYDLNQNDIYKEYSNGPFSGILYKLGIGAYGIRNPIYKINS
jgi:hypothetical protein